MADAVIIDVVRTASGRGKIGGALSDVHPAELLSLVIKELIQRNEFDPALVDDVIAGCVIQHGDQPQNIARTAALAAGLPVSVPGTTVDRQCGSSQQAVHFAAQGVIAGAYDIVIACGVESMSRVPMGSSVADGDPLKPLHSRYPNLPNQGIGAELVAARWELGREALDLYAAESHRRAAHGTETGAFTSQIVPVALQDGKVHSIDETVRDSTTSEKLGELQPSFYTEEMAQNYPEIRWHVTPGNSSPLTDGASAALIMGAKIASELGLKPRARFHAFALAGSDPEIMLTGPIPATRKILDRSGLLIDDLDAYEVNEAFAPVPLAWAHEFSADLAKLNPCGGAIALGHPLGASGTRLLCTLLNHLEAIDGRYGLQTMCEGGGMANAMIIERLK